MEFFNLSLRQLLMMLLLMAIGYVLRKEQIVPENAQVTLSKLEINVFIPSLMIINQLSNCTVSNLVNNSGHILYGFAVGLVAVIISYPLSGLFIKHAKGDAKSQYQKNICKYALTFGNFGFMGNYLVLEIWGEEMLFKYVMITFFLSILCNLWGLYVLIPKGEVSVKENIRKGLTAPPIIALAFGAVCGLLNLKQYFPEFVLAVLDNASDCMGPCAMLLTGMVVGGYNLKELLMNKKMYLVSFMRLCLLPALFVLLLIAMGVGKEIMSLIFVAFATPIGLNTIVFPSAYGGDTKTGASMAVISHIFSVVTIPVMYFLLLELF